jgi:pilus assembly protein CpaF
MEGELVTLQDLFVFDKKGLTEKLKVRGCFRATGIRPKFYERLAACGLELPASIFASYQEVG